MCYLSRSGDGTLFALINILTTAREEVNNNPALNPIAY